MTLYLFNPEHDYALANNHAHFMPPASAIKFADDCALFLQYIVPKQGLLFLPYRKEHPFYDLSLQQFTKDPTNVCNIKQVVPWGWDKLIFRQLSDVLPTLPFAEQNIDTIRQIAHRRIAIEGMEYLRKHHPALTIPPSATLLHTSEEVAHYIQQHQNVILKSPYSGNGRGNLYTRQGVFSATLQRQTEGVIRRQGAILGEPLYDVVQDFALEYLCKDKHATFAGYSFFNTQHYGYAGNLLCADQEIEQKLTAWIPLQQLHTLRDGLQQFIQTKVAPHYSGYVGVDLFVYQEDGDYKVNPFVEINVRMTMGMAAHILYERHVHPAANGFMRLVYRAQQGELLDFVRSQKPMELKDNRWYNGVSVLHPVDCETQYAIMVEVHPFFVSLQP